ncbi:hypothetical protein AVDCRST_MAG84-1705 [uncultured Microcoleus sp.]|uniref:Uncharacterized protein n=1 Tax=uncultured Microcoleus sp. TaxID=259945 RepID=A0A6J4LAJ3_9CYAN|nr:hypothetical protein AVDCRST_MAG84-1705 [uncultured Microcoleus sp.]
MTEISFYLEELAYSQQINTIFVISKTNSRIYFSLLFSLGKLSRSS